MMHIQRNQMNITSVNPYSASAENAIAAQRAAKVRKKLIKSTTDIDVSSNPQAPFIVGHWLDAQPDPAQNSVQNPAPTKPRMTHSTTPALQQGLRNLDELQSGLRSGICPATPTGEPGSL
jgi:hypothetical protein